MTTFILHGGESSAETPTNEAFWALQATHIPQGGTWLGCYFARYNEASTEKFNRDSAKIKTSISHPITCLMATSEEFEQQLKNADVIYFSGGSTMGLLNNLKQWPELKNWLQSKPVIAGCSAGMNILGNQFLTKKGEVGEGYGLVPFNLIVHHRAPQYDEAHATARLPAPTLALHETQFCVLEL